MRKLQYAQAISAYEDLRIEFPVSFAKDLHNLSICYLKTNQPDNAVSLARELVLQGRELHEFDKYIEYASIADMDCWADFIHEYLALRKRYGLEVDSVFLNLVGHFFVADQKYQYISDEKRDSVYC